MELMVGVGVQVVGRSLLGRNSLNKTHCFGRSAPLFTGFSVCLFGFFFFFFFTHCLREYSTSAFAQQHFTRLEM